MALDGEALRAILKQYIGPAYDRALRNTGGDAEAARQAADVHIDRLKDLIIREGV